MAVKQVKKKIIFTDLDETLLKDNKYYFEIVHNFISKLFKCEYIIIPVTSKTYLEVIDLLKKIKFKVPFSVENGAAYYVPVKNTKDYLFKKIFNPSAFSKTSIMDILSNKIFKKYLNNIEFIENLSFIKQKEITKLSFDQLVNFNSREHTIPILWSGDRVLKKEFEENLLKHNLKISFGGKLNNISGLHSKVDSMSFFVRQYKQEFKNKNVITISLGDSQNDIEILNNSNYSGIVKNDNYKIINLKKKNNIFRSFTKAPHGWVEVLKKIIIKMEKDYY